MKPKQGNEITTEIATDLELAQVDEEMQALALRGLAMKLGDLILYKTLDRIRSVVYEAERIHAGVPSGTEGAAALPVSVTAIAAIGLDYQLARYRAAQKTAGYRARVIPGAIVCRRRRAIKSIAACAYSTGAEGRKCSRVWSRRHA